MSEPTIAELLASVNALAARVESLEAELAAVRAELPPPGGARGRRDRDLGGGRGLPRAPRAA